MPGSTRSPEKTPRSVARRTKRPSGSTRSTAAVLDAAERAVFIPQLGRIGSLNVATAASIALYEARRQAWPGA